jgi:hypothetical protein
MVEDKHKHNRLGHFLQEVSNWRWDEFVRAERDKSYSTNQSIIFALIRSCAMRKMDAIKISLNRLDGKLKTPVQIEYPKVFYLYPNAVMNTNSTQELNTNIVQLTNPENVFNVLEDVVEGEVLPPKPEPEADPINDEDLPSLSLRETLRKMSDYPRELPEAIVERADEVQMAIRGKGPMPDDIPMVKSVVAAHLLIMAQKRDIDALYEVFDQIDGKLVETIQVLGEDIYITSYASEAPPEATPNKDGILQVEASQVQALWTEKLGSKYN